MHFFLTCCLLLPGIQESPSLREPRDITIPELRNARFGWLWYTPDGKHLLAFSSKQTDYAHVIDIKNKTLVRSLVAADGYKERAFLACAPTADGKTLCIVSQDHHVRKWDINSGKLISDKDAFPIWGTTTLSNNGQYLAAEYNTSDLTRQDFKYDPKKVNHVRVLDANTLEELALIPNLPGKRPSRLAVHPKGKYLACAYDDGILVIWNVTEREPYPARVFKRGRSLGSLTFSPDGRILVYQFDSSTGQIPIKVNGRIEPYTESSSSLTVYHLDSRKEVTISLDREHELMFSSLIFSPNGKYLALVGEGSAYLTETDKLDLRLVIGKSDPRERDNGFPLAFSPDSKTIATAHGNTIKFWDIDKLLAPKPGPK